MANRDTSIKFRVSQEELDLIHRKMELLRTDNLSAYIRKMAIDGHIIKLELADLKELVSLLRYTSNNLNQLTRRAHETGRIYDSDLEDLHRSLDKIWTDVQSIMHSLAKL